MLIPKDEQQNVMDLFWVFLRNQENSSQADNDFLLRRDVENGYELWNRIYEQNRPLKPQWLKTNISAKE